MKVLIVDDNKENLNLLKDFTESWGYETLLAQNGIEALEFAKVKRPDIILLDVMLPGISGYEVCHSIRTNLELRSIPVILLTALSEEENRIQGYSVGADGFLSKPINYKELKVMIENFLTRSRFLHKTESRRDISIFIEDLILKETSENEYNDLKEKYCRKLIDCLQLNDEISERLEVAGRLFSKKAYKRDSWKFVKLNKLKMGEWLVPLLKYLHEYKDSSSKKENESFGIEAEILIVVNKFGELRSEGLTNGRIIEYFSDNKDEMGYDSLVVDKLKELIKAEELLESLEG